LVWAALTVGVAIGGALGFALLGPAGRAGAVASVLAALASTTAALTALYLSREALTRTDRQLALTRRATVLGRYPLLLPVHQSVEFPGSTGALAQHPPALDRFRLTPPAAGSYAFLQDVGERFVIPVENVGEGPALRVRGRLWRDDGHNGLAVGPTALGAGRLMVMTAVLLDTGPVPNQFTQALDAVAGADRSAAGFYWLELAYTDVFANELGVWAFFDPRGVGTWRYVTPPTVESSSPMPVPD
jgi:hypothetical protein